MKLINIRFKRLRVSGFNAQQGSVSLEIFFNDGANKQITRTTIIDDPKALAHSIVDEIISMEKSIHYEFDEDGTLQSRVAIVVQDEDIVLDNLANFLAQISHRIKTILSSKLAEGYMNKIRDLNRMGFEF